MDLNQVRRLAGLPEQALALAAPVLKEETLPEAKVIRDEPLNEGKSDNEIKGICGELEAALKRCEVKITPQVSKAVANSVRDAYEVGYDAGAGA